MADTGVELPAQKWNNVHLVEVSELERVVLFGQRPAQKVSNRPASCVHLGWMECQSLHWDICARLLVCTATEVRRSSAERRWFPDLVGLSLARVRATANSASVYLH